MYPKEIILDDIPYDYLDNSPSDEQLDCLLQVLKELGSGAIRPHGHPDRDSLFVWVACDHEIWMTVEDDEITVHEILPPANSKMP